MGSQAGFRELRPEITAASTKSKKRNFVLGSMLNAHCVAKAEELCWSYVAAMISRNLEALLAKLAYCATATPPISGEQPDLDF